MLLIKTGKETLPKVIELCKHALDAQPFRPHDFRRALASWMGDRNISEAVHDRVLNHYRKSVRKVYNGSRYNTPAKKAWYEWGQYLAGLAADNVVQLRKQS